MSGGNRDRAARDGDAAAEQAGAWDLDRRIVWSWVSERLGALASEAIDAGALRALCAQVLDTHAPAALVHAQAAGIYLEHLVYAAIVRRYADRFGRPSGAYDVASLRLVVRELRDGVLGHAPS